MANLIGNIFTSVINNVKQMTISNGFTYDWADPNPQKYSTNVAQTLDIEAGHVKPLALLYEFDETSSNAIESGSTTPSEITNEVPVIIESIVNYNAESANSLDYQITAGAIIQDIKKQFNREQNAGWIDPVTTQCTALSGIYVSSQAEPFNISKGQLRVFTEFLIKYRQDRTDPGILR